MLGPNESIPEPGASPKPRRGFNLDMGWLIDLKEQYFSNPNTFALAALVTGIVVGLFVGWVVWPVKWKDASAEHLRQDLQIEWVRMVADSYGVGASSSDDAVRRLRELGEKAPEALAAAAANPGPGSSYTLAALEEVRNYYEKYGGEPIPDIAPGVILPEPTTALEVMPEGEAVDEGVPGGFQPAQTVLPEDIALVDDTGGGSKFSSILLICTFVVLLAVGVATALYLRRNGVNFSLDGLRRQPRQQAYDEYEDQPAEARPYSPMETEPPIAQWMTTYLKGDDLYDDSFSIDAINGEFLGECGVGIAEAIGVGEPKRVSAFEIWLFDKNDIQTVTKVLMSEYLFNDQASHNRLAAKGEPILGGPGAQFIMQTETLQMLVRVVDLNYGIGALPDNSYFDRLSLELSVWTR